MKIGLTNIVSCKIGSTQVNRVYIGSTLIWSYSAFDPDAQLFITNAAITEPVQQSAVNNLVIDLKNYGVWSKMKALYPFVGGTAAQHKFNLKNPLDTDAAFRLIFNGGWVHSNGGALPNGTNAFADTKLSPLTNLLTTANAHLSYYARTTRLPSDACEIGNFRSVGGVLGGLVIQGRTSQGTNRYFYTLSSAASRPVTNSPLGFICGSSISNARRDLFVNGTSLANNTTTDNWTTLSESMYIGAANSTNVAIYFTSVQLAFSSIGNGLTSTEAANFNTAVQTFQTTLSRNV